MAGLAAGWLAGAHHVVRALLDDDEAAVHNYHRQTCSELDCQRFGVGEAQLGLKNRAQLTVPHNGTHLVTRCSKLRESRKPSFDGSARAPTRTVAPAAESRAAAGLLADLSNSAAAARCRSQ